MNTENILQLADEIERQEHAKTDEMKGWGFNMAYFRHDCGTPCCIAGFAAEHVRRNVGEQVEMITEVARKWLEIDRSTALSLFIPDVLERHGVRLSDITPAMAARTLRNLAETGRVEWNVS